jgi:hypothetical protein
MNTEKKEAYVAPKLGKHELLRDITAAMSGPNGNGCANGNPNAPGLMKKCN